MTVNVGVIGVGMIGQDHIRRLTSVTSGAKVVAVTDINAQQVAQITSAVDAKPDDDVSAAADNAASMVR